MENFNLQSLNFRRLLLLAIVCIASLRGVAAYICGSTTIDNINYCLWDDHSASVMHKNYTGDIIIPAEVSYKGTTYKVAVIGHSAFKGCSGLTSVTIPGSVTSIGNYAFEDCSGLTSVTISESVTSIGDYAFEDCSGLTSVTIPGSVTSIGFSTFSGCPKLQINVNEDNPKYSSRDGWLYDKYCTELIKGNELRPYVSIPNGVTSIGDYAFEDCSGLTSVTIPESVTSIGSSTFYGCSGKLVVHVPVFTYAFYLSRISNVVLIADIGEGKAYTATVKEAGTFFSRLNSDEALKYTKLTIKGNINGTDLKKINTFTNLLELDLSEANIVKGGESYYLGYETSDNVLRPHCLFGLYTLKSLILPNSLKGVTGEYTHGDAYGAFEHNKVLQEIVFGENISFIGPYAFKSCSLASLTIPGSVKSIGDHAFIDCSSLTSLTIPESVTSIGEYAFCRCTGLTSVTIPGSVTSIGGYAFYGCSGLTSVTIPGSVTSIGKEAFCGCSGLTSVTIPGSVTSIEESTFKGCTGLTSMTIPEGVTDISKDILTDCANLTFLSLPSSLKKINDYAFNGCSGLKEIWNYGLVPLEIMQNVFNNGTYDTATLYVPQSAKTEYEEDPVWQMFQNIKTFDPTAIAAPADGDSMVTIRRIGGNAIFVEGANGNPVTVYDAAGHAVSRGKATFSGLPHGLYIVRVGGRSYKVAM